MRAAIPPGAMPSHSPAETPAVRVLPLTLFVHMYKGCTREAHRTNTLAVPDPHERGKTEEPTFVGRGGNAQAVLVCEAFLRGGYFSRSNPYSYETGAIRPLVGLALVALVRARCGSGG